MLQNFEFRVYERATGFSEACRAISAKVVASDKSYYSLKIGKNREKNSKFSDFHPYRIDSELQVSIDLWPCIVSKNSIFTSLSALEELLRPALKFRTRRFILRKVISH